MMPGWRFASVERDGGKLGVIAQQRIQRHA